MTGQPDKSGIEAAWFEFKSGTSSSIENKLVEIETSSLEYKLREIDRKLDTVAKNLYQVGMMIHQFVLFSRKQNKDHPDFYRYRPKAILEYMDIYLNAKQNIDRLEKNKRMHNFDPMPANWEVD